MFFKKLLQSTVSNETIPCKCCGGVSKLFDVTDFNVSCEDHKKPVFDLSGIPIYYHRCLSCKFIFTSHFDSFKDSDFEKYIYNNDYVKVDPDYVSSRSTGNAIFVKRLLPEEVIKSLSIIDYGGGNGQLASLLKKDNINCSVYDPFSENNIKPKDKFDLMVSFEVVEHTPDPINTFKEMISLLKDNGVIVFSTLLQPDNIDNIKLNWWYAAPRNGHISLHSKESLSSCLKQFGFSVAPFGNNQHIAFKKDQLPEFSKHWFG